MKQKVPVLCNIVSIILVIAFFIKIIADYAQYTKSFTSAPFSVWVQADALSFLLPALIVFVIGFIVKKKL